MLLSAIPAVAEEQIVAKVNASVITVRDLDAEVDRLIPLETYHKTVSEEKRNEYRDKALQNLIDRELQYQDAVSRSMKPDSKLVKAQMKEIRDRFKSKKEYQSALERVGLTEDQLKTQVEKNVLVQAIYAKTVTDPSLMSEGALKEYYDKNISKFRQPDDIKLSLISTKNEKKAGEILALLQNGEDFGTVAYRMSEDNYRVMNGNIGYVHKGRVLPEIESVAFSLKIGEKSGLIKADGTWFIIKVEDKRPERQMSYNESKAKLKKDLEASRSEELLAKWMSGLKGKAAIEIISGNNEL